MNEEFTKKRIIEAIRNSGFSHPSIAKHLNVHRNTIFNWANGKSMPNALRITKLSDLIKKDISWFYDDINKTNEDCVFNLSILFEAKSFEQAAKVQNEIIYFLKQNEIAKGFFTTLKECL